MEFSRELLFFFSALGAFNGLLLSVYFLFFVKEKKASHPYLGMLLLLLSIRTAKSIFLFFNPNLFELFVQVGLSACFLIGPSLYLYLISETNSKSSQLKHWWLHLVPYLLLISIVSYLYPYYENMNLWQQYLIRGIYWQWLIYIILSGIYLRFTIKKIFVNSQKLSLEEIWKLSVFIGVLIIWGAYNTTAYTSYITGAISFTFILYVFFLVLFLRKTTTENLISLKEKYVDKKIDDSFASIHLERLNSLMITDELFKKSNLKSSEVAKLLQLTTHQFSQLLNDNLGKSFPVFINEYKIDEAKKMIKNNSNLTLEAIGYECGFNSKSTFYTAFKRIVGTTPAKYKEQL